MGYIYKITNLINNKLYIGKTELEPPEKRWLEHKHDYQRRRNEKRPLYSAMRKYGVENFKFEVLEKTKDTIEREKYYINKYRTYVGFNDCNGYNATLGGDGKCYLTVTDEDVIECYNQYGVVQHVANALNIDNSTVSKILKRNNIQTLSEIELRDFVYYLKYGGVVKINIEDNKIIDIYRSVNEVCRENTDYNSDTIGCALYKHCKAYGYYWRRLNELKAEQDLVFA